MIVRGSAALAAFVAGYLLVTYAADEIAGLLGELFARTVISADNVTEGS